MSKITKPNLRKAAAVAKELGVEVRIDADGNITFSPAQPSKQEAA